MASTVTRGASARQRLRRTNLVAAVAFTCGGLLFALGACVAQFGSGDASTAATIFFAGGLCFNTGGYASLLLAINAADGEHWRWWSYEPRRLDWLSAFVLLAGTIAFGLSLIDSFLQGLAADQINRLIWAPEMFGCLLFLISGHLAMRVFSNRFWPVVRWGDLGWWITATNQIGSIAFLVSAIGAFIRPVTDSDLNVAVANWGTLIGALCFAAGGVLQAFLKPGPATR